MENFKIDKQSLMGALSDISNWEIQKVGSLSTSEEGKSILGTDLELKIKRFSRLQDKTNGVNVKMSFLDRLKAKSLIRKNYDILKLKNGFCRSVMFEMKDVGIVVKKDFLKMTEADKVNFITENKVGLVKIGYNNIEDVVRFTKKNDKDFFNRYKLLLQGKDLETILSERTNNTLEEQ